MVIQNSDISLLVQKARKKRNFTQKKLALLLKKSPMNISDIERGKVKITAEDLSKIADALNKPIEYFYGVDFGAEAIQDMITIFRRSPPEAREAAVKTSTLILRMLEKADAIRFDSKSRANAHDANDFISSYQEFNDGINGLTATLNGMRFLLENAQKAQGSEIMK